MVDEEIPELNPPSPERVAERALVLSAVVCRSGIECDAGKADAEKFRQAVVDWVKNLHLDAEAEAAEMEMLQTPLGKLDKKLVLDASWRTEGLAVLAWGLGRYGLPRYDKQAIGFAAADVLGFMQPRERTVLRAPELRSRAQIAALADQLFTLHWRLRQFSLDHKAIDFEEVARTAWFGPLKLEGLSLNEKDLEIYGFPISVTMRSMCLHPELSPLSRPGSWGGFCVMS